MMRLRLLCLPVPALLAACATNQPLESASPIRLPRGVTYHERVQTYRVVGADRAAIGQGIRIIPGKGGRLFAGKYEWRLAWRFGNLSDGPQGSLSPASVAIQAVVTLPEWSAPAGADPMLVEEWQRYIAALTTHETGHRELVLAGAKRIQGALLDIAPQDCSAMPGAARQAAQQLLAEIQREDLRYDEITRHGATQGAVWTGINPWWLSQ